MERFPDVYFSLLSGMAHATFHAEARSNPQLYLHRDPVLIPYLERLAGAGKKLFVITNSPFETVDKGMSYMVGPQWREFFDVIIVQAGQLDNISLSMILVLE